MGQHTKPEESLSILLQSGREQIGYNLCNVNSQDTKLNQLGASTSCNLQYFYMLCSQGMV